MDTTGNPEGDPLDRAYADWAWQWIDRILAESDDFDYLFVGSHYQVLDVRGYFDAALVAKLLPLMKRSKVSAYFQGHRHSLEHNQEHGFSDISDIHYFTIGAGALIEKSLIDGVPSTCIEV